MHCPRCNQLVKNTDKFCSNCGYQLISTVYQKISEEFTKVKIKLCDICGEENFIDAEECQHCGVQFTGKEKIIEKKVKVEGFEEKPILFEKERSIKGKTSSKKKTRQKANTTIEKEKGKLSPLQIILIAAGFLILGAVLVYYSLEESNVKLENLDTGNFPQVDQRKVDLNVLSEINALEKELERNPNDKQNLLRLANLLHDGGFFEKAINNYESYLKINPNDFDAEVDMGVCYYELKQYEKAEEIFKGVVNKNPNHQIAHLNLGIVNLTLGNIDKAKEYFQKCIALGEHTDAGHRAAELLKSH